MTMLSVLALVFLCATPAGSVPGPAELTASSPNHDLPYTEQRTAVRTVQLSLPDTRNAAAPASLPRVRRNRYEVVPAFWYQSATYPLQEASLPPPCPGWSVTQRRVGACVLPNPRQER